jgi:hypothetical protein
VVQEVRPLVERPFLALVALVACLVEQVVRPLVERPFLALVALVACLVEQVVRPLVALGAIQEVRLEHPNRVVLAALEA